MILYAITRGIISYTGIHKTNTFVRTVRIFFAWIIWVVIFFAIKIFSKEEKKSEELEKDEQMDERIKEAK
jgi:phosphotransferase system  glucose/maltose/N-acetylglucosamine-specific IIC component